MPRTPHTAHRPLPSAHRTIHGPAGKHARAAHCAGCRSGKNTNSGGPRGLCDGLYGVCGLFSGGRLLQWDGLPVCPSVCACLERRALFVSSRLVVSLSRLVLSCFVSRCLFGKRCEWVFTPVVLRRCLCGCAKEGFLGLFVLLLSHRSLCALPPLQLFSGTVCIIYKCFGIAARCRPGPLDQLNYTLLLCSVLLFPSLLVLLLFWPCVCMFAAPVVSLVARPFASRLSLPPLFSYI